MKRASVRFFMLRKKENLKYSTKFYANSSTFIMHLNFHKPKKITIFVGLCITQNNQEF